MRRAATEDLAYTKEIRVLTVVWDVEAINAAIAAGDMALAPPGSTILICDREQKRRIIKYETFDGAPGNVMRWAVLDEGGWMRRVEPSLVVQSQIISIPENPPSFSLWPRADGFGIFFVSAAVHLGWFAPNPPTKCNQIKFPF